MTELAMIFMGGLLGSSHCLGMCGGFALSLGGTAPHWSANLRRQLAYSGGRIFTYSMAGAAAGYVGMRVARGLPTVVHTQAILAVAAGVLLIVQGLSGAGFAVLPARTGQHKPCLSTGLLGAFLRTPRWHGPFLAGVFTGFLPCGLVYAYLALAASAGELAQGLICMAAFGAGTVPLMVAAGCGGSLLGLAARRRAVRLAAWLVVATGVVSIVRGAGFWGWSAGDVAAACPWCQ